MVFEIYDDFNKKYIINDEFIKKYPKYIAYVSDVLVHPYIYEVIPKYGRQLYDRQIEKWVRHIRHNDYSIPGESDYNQGLRLIKQLIDVHPELVGLLKVSDGSGEMIDYVPEGLFKFNEDFIKNNLENWILLEDYLPFDISKYESLDFSEEGWTAQDDRESYLGEQFKIYKEMNDIILQKCIAYEDRIKAFNSVVIEWVDCHPEFEGIISKESIQEYHNMKNNNEFIPFNDLLDFVKLPSESNDNQINLPKDHYTKDDSSIRLPNFKAIDKIFNKYGASLLSCYLSYLV